MAKMIKIIKNFISNREKSILNKWALENYQKEFFYDPNMDPFNSGTRLTTRKPPNVTQDYIEFPKVSYEIKSRIQKKLNIIFAPHPNQFFNGIVCGVGFENGSIFEHTDPIYYRNTYTLHCNLITQKPLYGGITVIKGKTYETEERDLLCYIVSHQEHLVTPSIGKRERVLWCYGFSILEQQMYNIFKP
jgi:hypothetical protein